MISLGTSTRPAPDGNAFVAMLLALADVADPETVAHIVRMAKEAGEKRRAVWVEAEAEIASRFTAVEAAEADVVRHADDVSKFAAEMNADQIKREAAIGAKSQKLDAKTADLTEMIADNKALLAELKTLKAQIDEHNATLARREAKAANVEKAATQKMAEAEAMHTEAAEKLARMTSIMSAPLVGG